MTQPTRREFVQRSLATVAGSALIPHALSAAPLRIRKGILLDMLPASNSYTDRLKLAREIGFEVLQAPTEPDHRKAEELRAAAESSGIRIDSVMNMDHWKYPLSSSDPTV